MLKMINKKKEEEAPTKRELWEQIKKLTDTCVEKAWQSGFDSGMRCAGEINIEDLLKEEGGEK